MAWERQLLVPFVERLVDDALAGSARREQTSVEQYDEDKEKP
jgi:hypothetical protein